MISQETAALLTMISYNSRKRKICVVTTSRADYGRLKPVMREIQNHPELELQVVAGTSLFLDHFFWYLRHGEPLSWWRSLSWHIRARRITLFGSKDRANRLEHLLRMLAGDGFPIHARLPIFLEGGNQRVMVKSAGLGLLGVPDIFEKLKPDVILLHGDRFEILPVAIAASFSNIPIAHIEGGDVSGTIDNSVRHAITKLAHIHFPVTEKSRDRIIKMGEDPRFVFHTGTPIIDFVKSVDLSLDNSFYYRYPPLTGGIESMSRRVDLTKPYLLVLQHPVTTEYASNYDNMKNIMEAIDALKLPVMVIFPNVDAGADGVTTAIKEYYYGKKPPFAVFLKGLIPEDFCKVLAHASVAIGNSSSFLREGGFMGTPIVLVGNRQEGRESGKNVMHAGCNKNEIIDTARTQLAHGKYAPTSIFGDGTASKKIVSILTHIDLPALPLHKKFYEV